MNGIVIPCYNEENRIDLEAYKEFLNSNSDYFILFVDDGSVDETKVVLSEFCSPRSNAEVITLKKNQGKAEAVRSGIQYLLTINCQIIGFLDADLATPFSEAKRLIFELERNDKLLMVMGSRLNNILGGNIHRSFFRKISSFILSLLFKMATNIIARDTQCGAKFFKSEELGFVFTDPFLTKWLFDIEILHRINASSYDLYTECREIPIYYWRDMGDSKIGWRDIILIMRELNVIRKNYNNGINSLFTNIITFVLLISTDL